MWRSVEALFRHQGTRKDGGERRQEEKWQMAEQGCGESFHLKAGKKTQFVVLYVINVVNHFHFVPYTVSLYSQSFYTDVLTGYSGK